MECDQNSSFRLQNQYYTSMLYDMRCFSMYVSILGYGVPYFVGNISSILNMGMHLSSVALVALVSLVSLVSLAALVALVALASLVSLVALVSLGSSFATYFKGAHLFKYTFSIF